MKVTLPMSVFRISRHVAMALAQSLTALGAGYFWKTLALTALICLGICGGFFYYVWDYFSTAQFEDLWGFETLINTLGPWFAGFIALLIVPLFFPLVSLLFLDQVVSKVEKTHYPDALSKPIPLIQSIESTAILMSVALFLNMLLMPLYLVPGLNLLVYFTLNGYILGREYFEMIALRHMGKGKAKELRRAARLAVWVAGVIITFSFMVPGLNLIAPVIATVFMTHLFQRLQKNT